MNQKIHQRGSEPTAIELPAASAILPGHLIERAAGGTLQPHSTAGGDGESLFAQEDALQGKIVTDAYATGDPVNAYSERGGNITLAILKAGFAYTTATKLISAGDGTLKPTTGTPAKVYGSPLAALDISASGAVNTLAQVVLW
jgi:hypothetical protein